MGGPRFCSERANNLRHSDSSRGRMTREPLGTAKLAREIAEPAATRFSVMIFQVGYSAHRAAVQTMPDDGCATIIAQ